MSTETNAETMETSNHTVDNSWRTPIEAVPTKRKLVVRLMGPGHEEQGEEFRAEVPNTKLAFIVLRSDDVSADALHEMADQLRRKEPGREFVILAIDPKDTVEFFEEI